MKTYSQRIRILVVASMVAASSAHAVEPPVGEKDPFRATLTESKDKSKGVIVHSGGAAIPMVVMSLDERYVIGRSQTAPRIVVRLDRIDAISASL